MNGDAFHWCRKTLNYNLGKHDLLRILGRETSLSLFLPHTYTQFIIDTVVNRTVVMCLPKGEMRPTSELGVVVFYFTAPILFQVKVHNDLYLFTWFLWGLTSIKDISCIILNMQTFKVWWRTWPLHLHYSGRFFAMRPWQMTLQISRHLHLK